MRGYSRRKNVMKQMGILLLICAVIGSVFTGCAGDVESSKNHSLTETTTSTFVTTTTTAASSVEGSLDLSCYTDTYWSTENINWQNGGYILTVSINETINKAIFNFDSIQGAPESRMATAVMETELGEIRGKEIDLHFSSDGWGHSGDVKLNFSDSVIFFTISNVTSVDAGYYADWGFHDTSGSLVNNPNAYKNLTMTEEEYDSTHQPVYDTSKASGILAQAGLTEEQFRNMCTPLHDNSFNPYSFAHRSNSLFEIDRYDFAVGQQYYQDNPSDNGVTEAKEEWQKICKDYMDDPDDPLEWNDSFVTNVQYSSNKHYYEKYQIEEIYLNEQVYAKKGYSQIYNYTENLFKSMKEYPNDYVGQCFVLLDAPTSLYDDDYAGVSIKVYDLRDDPSNPNIISGYDYYYYVIFAGARSVYGDIVLDFNLISLEKISE